MFISKSDKGDPGPGNLRRRDLSAPARPDKTGQTGGVVAGRPVDRLKSRAAPPTEIVFVMTDASETAVTILDTSGMLCPLPVLKARRALKPLPPGAVLEVIATDPGAIKDFEHFCNTTGCELLESKQEAGGILRFRLRKPL
jgi:tRNA 2-thiouridine synthesizing protein A